MFLLTISWEHYLCRKLTMDSLSVTGIHYESIIVLAYSSSVTQIHNLFHNMNSQYFCPNRYQPIIFREFNLNLLSLSRFCYSLSFRENVKNLLFFTNLLWIYDQSCEFTTNPLSFRRINKELTKNSLWIHYLIRGFIKFTIFIRNQYELYIFFSISQFFFQTYYLFRGITMNALSLCKNSRIHYGFIILIFANLELNYYLFGNLLLIYYRFRWFTLNSLSVTRNHYVCIISRE